jgi:predicted secreted hydrolase
MNRGIERWLAPGAILVALLGLSLALILRSGDAAGEGVRATLDLAEAMGGTDTVGYARALQPRPFVFPEDHGPHPEYRTEWWYVTANLEGEDGRRFGTQFTLFRSALAPEPSGAERGDGMTGSPDPSMVGDGMAEEAVGRAAGDGMTGVAGADAMADEMASRGSGWATRQVHMGHFALTDVEGGAFYEAERFTRVANGLAGGTVDPLRIWMDGWSFSGGGSASEVDPSAGAVFPFTVQAQENGVSIDLTLEPAKRHVLQGDRGLSQKGREPGNASFYYSFTRLEARGVVEVDGQTHTVDGTAWLDREWSTSALSDGQEGWDWFAIQLSDGRDLMVYRLRGPDDTTDPMSEGVIVSPDGSSRRLTRDDFQVTATDRWTSPLDGSVYPSGWEVSVPSEELRLLVEPVLEDQELNVTVRYWEGAVDVREITDEDELARAGAVDDRERPGTAEADGPLTGWGYVELTGYSAPVTGRIPESGSR